MILTDRRIFVYKLPSKFIRCSGGLHISMSDQIKRHQVKRLVTSRWGSSIFTALYSLRVGATTFLSQFTSCSKSIFFFGLCRVFFLFQCVPLTCTAATSWREPPSSFPCPLVPESEPCSWASSTSIISLKYIFLPMQLFSLPLTNTSPPTLRAQQMPASSCLDWEFLKALSRPSVHSNWKSMDLGHPHSLHVLRSHNPAPYLWLSG